MTDYSYSIAGVTDIDQRWAGLPGGGGMYCVPTATANWLYYMASHGRPSAIWLPPPDPSVPGSTIMNLVMVGSYMETDPAHGTSSSGWFDGLLDWLNDRNVPAMLINYCSRDDAAVTFETLQAWAVRGLMTIAIGRYNKVSSGYDRVGGHAVSIVGLRRTSTGCQIIVHDPAQDDGNSMKQSSTAEQTVSVTNQSGQFEGEQTTLIRWGSSTAPYLFVDQCFIILPSFAVTSLTGGELTIYSSSLTSDAVETKEIPTSLSAGIADLAIHPLLGVVAALGGETGDVVTVDLTSGATKKLARLPGAARLAYGGRSPRLFIAQERDVVALDDAGKELSRARLDHPIDALSFDHTEDRLVVASSAAGKLLHFSPRLEARETRELPPVPGKGRLSLTTNPRDGTLCITRAGSPQVTTVRVHPTGAVARGTSRLLSTGVTSAAHVDRHGNLYVSEDRRIATFDTDGNRRKGSPFDGLPAGPLLKVARSYSNADPVKMSKPEWRNGSAR
ncbi:hypothetical protein [Sorangium sp. So ce1153]|uniref:hypothetical protein n=1 Tax=Sorangium sp. So ce1153 TaxID=3133333 RepID=UPI003F60BFF3